MGLCLSRIYFEKGLPSVDDIRKQFQIQTGLHIQIIADINLLELPVNNRQVVERLTRDIDKYEEFNNKKIGGWNNMREERQKINHIGHFQFYHFQFYGIDFLIQEQTIEMEYGIGCYYFPSSLNKSLFDLRGRFVDQHNEPTTGWESTKEWKKLRHWDDYKWYRKPRR